MMMLVASSVFMGAAWDMSNAWMHKQWADTAAQAACSAGTMDMAWAANNVPVGGTPTTPVPSFNFLPAAGSTNSGDCGVNSSNPICYYAKLNGYDSVTNNDVSWATSTTPPSSLPTGSTTMTQSTNGVPAFLNVTVTENVPASFFGVFAKFLGLSNSWQSVPVVGHCNCGMTGSYQSGTSSTDSTYSAGSSIGNMYCNTGPGYSMTCDTSTLRTNFPVNQAVAANQTVTVSVYVSTTVWVNCCSADLTWAFQCGTFGPSGQFYGVTGDTSFMGVVTFVCSPGTITNLNQIAVWGWADASSEPENYQNTNISEQAWWAGADISTPGVQGGWTNIRGASFQTN